MTSLFFFGNLISFRGPRMPAWDYYKEYLDFLKRTQYTLQSGVAKVDVAIYRKDYDITGSVSPSLRHSSMQSEAKQ